MFSVDGRNQSKRTTMIPEIEGTMTKMRRIYHLPHHLLNIPSYLKVSNWWFEQAGLTGDAHQRTLFFLPVLF